MLGRSMNDLYSALRVYFYMQIFTRFETKEATLTAVESFSMECIKYLGEPTVSEFAHLMGISSPNAAYKVNSLVKKGYIEKKRSENDKREYHLCPTEKYMEYYRISQEYMNTVVERCKVRFTEKELNDLDSMLQIIKSELMPELDRGKITSS
ncbi:MAG: winged helix-turn-helix transcriptional regulator [Lachnospiraceae bacterium]|nr:winged helix-turn-helix transcriptional regulator [Lachnospiraceae bacterium]